MDRGYVYILCNDRRNVLYIGVTSDLKKRMYHHKRQLIAGFTNRYNVHRLVYFEAHNDMATARAREKKLKGFRREKKESLASGMNPSWRDLYEHLDMSQIGKSG